MDPPVQYKIFDDAIDECGGFLYKSYARFKKCILFEKCVNYVKKNNLSV